MDISLSRRREKGGFMERDELRLLMNSFQRGRGFFGGAWLYPPKSDCGNEADRLLRREVEG